MGRLGICLACFATPVAACDTALVLAVDVSNSIDTGEFNLQTNGIADAILDPIVLEALVSGRVALSVVQWSGIGTQRVSIPWRRITSDREAQAFSIEARDMPRAGIMANTAIGNVMGFSLGLFAPVEDCGRHVVDISGDGVENAHSGPRPKRREAERAGIVINALAIEKDGFEVTDFYRQNVITYGGFVMTSRGYLDYPATLREKLQRELAKVIAWSGEARPGR